MARKTNTKAEPPSSCRRTLEGGSPIAVPGGSWPRSKALLGRLYRAEENLA